MDGWSSSPGAPLGSVPPAHAFSFQSLGRDVQNPLRGSKMGRGVAGKEAFTWQGQFLPSSPFLGPVRVVLSPQPLPVGTAPEIRQGSLEIRERNRAGGWLAPLSGRNIPWEGSKPRHLAHATTKWLVRSS